MRGTVNPALGWVLSSFIGISFCLAPRVEALYYNLGAFWRPSTCNGLKFVQVSGSGEQLSSTTNISLTPTTGHLLVAVANWDWKYNSAVSSASVSDSLGNAWNAAPPSYDPSGLGAIQVWWAYNVTGGSSDTVSITQAGSGPVVDDNEISVYEYSGFGASNPVDASASQASQTSTTILAPGNMTPLGGCDLIVAGFDSVYQSETIGAGLTQRYADVSYPVLVGDNALSGTHSGQVVDLSSTQSPASNDWSATQVAFVVKNYSQPAAPSPTKLAFTTSAQTLAKNTCSVGTTVQLQNASSVGTNTLTDVSFTLSGTSTTFYSDSGCLNAVSTDYIWATSNSQTFYMKFSTTGSHSITVTPSGYSAIMQTETVS